MRASRLYVVAQVPGLSGVKSAHRRQVLVMTGAMVSRRDVEVYAEFDPAEFDGRQWRVNDGRLPEHQPIVNTEDVDSHAQANRVCCLLRFDRGVGCYVDWMEPATAEEILAYAASAQRQQLAGSSELSVRSDVKNKIHLTSCTLCSILK